MRTKTKVFPFIMVIGLGFSIGLTSCKKDCENGPVSSATINNTNYAKAGQNRRPFSDYLSTQGSTSIYVAPFPDFQGWNSSFSETPIHLGAIDFNGTTAAYLASHGGKHLNTVVTGKIDEVAQRDGRAKVTVTVHTTNALTFAVTYDPNSTEPFPYMNNPLDFGVRPAQLLSDTTLVPALGTADFSFTFYNPSLGAPIPDFLELVSTRFDDIVNVSFHSMANGIFHASSGYAEGTSGKLKVDQIGLFKTGWHGAVGDGFPTENVSYIAQ